MKYIFSILTIAASLSVHAQSTTVYPQVINMFQSVQVQVYNSTDKQITCNGPIFIQTTFGQSETHFYNEYISPRNSSYRYIQLRNFNDRISSVSHSIYCREGF